MYEYLLEQLFSRFQTGAVRDFSTPLKNQLKRIASMATIMVEARQSQEDVGQLVAAALHDSFQYPEFFVRVNDTRLLVPGKIGSTGFSWKSAIILRMAKKGGSGNEERIRELRSLFIFMANATLDSGDELSWAMSVAVDTLGGLDAFAGESIWHEDLIKMGREYSGYWNKEKNDDSTPSER